VKHVFLHSGIPPIFHLSLVAEFFYSAYEDDEAVSDFVKVFKGWV